MRCILAILAILAFVSTTGAETVNRAAKQDIGGKGYSRVCALTEADNIEIVNRLSPSARISRFSDEQATTYIFLLRTGQTVEGGSRKIHGGYDVRFPVADRIYIISRPGETSVFPFFVVNGCVSRMAFQIPKALHFAILKQMKAGEA